MKRRIIAALCLALALLTLSSCGHAALTVEVWRRTSDAEHSVSEGLIQSERRSVQAQAGSINGAVSAFNAEPEDPGLARAAPGDAKILAWRLEGTELRLEASPEWAELTGFDRTLADCCAVLTFCALDGVDSVSIYSLGQRLAGPMDESYIVLAE